jgi:uncharacterized protein YdeI (BOF family)
MQRFAICLAILFLLAPVAEAQQSGGPQDAVRRWIDRILGKETITEVSDILKNPENFDGEEVTVEGIFTDRASFSWVRGDLWGIEDNGKKITVNVKQNETLKGRDFYQYIDGLYDKSVRVRGRIEVLEDGKSLKPLLVAEVSDIEVMQ